MNNKYVIRLLAVLLLSSAYFGCQTLSNNNQPDAIATDSLSVQSDTLNVCSFNIQFLGHFKKRDNDALSDILKNFDIVVVQELVAPPYDGNYPDGEEYTSDTEANAFFEAMTNQGFEYVLSEEDTGPGEVIHKKSSATEWWVAFYKSDKVSYAIDIPFGFIAEDRSHNPDYERVPYAFPFRSVDSTLDFVLISVHLAPGESATERRMHELASISSWIDSKDDVEKDFIILGDMNIEDVEELSEIIPEGYVSLNDECVRTNTLINNNSGQGAKPYDHVMYRPEYTSNEMNEEFDIVILNLIELMKGYWDEDSPYPGEPYDHNLFKQYYSDHNPVLFKLVSNGDDD
jgi:exonuclease III